MSVGITKYQAAVWIMGVRRLVDTRVLFSGSNSNSYKLTYCEYDYYNRMKAEVGRTSGSDLQNEHVTVRGDI